MMTSCKAFLVFLFAVSINGFAKAPKHFTPGDYTLVEGPDGDCGEGHFEIDKENDTLYLGALHLFTLHPKTETLSGDAPGDKDCTYESKDSLDAEARETILTFSETRFCRKVQKHQLVKRAHLREDLVTLEYVQTGEQPKSFKCVWKLSKP